MNKNWIETPRLLLRPLAAGDEALLYPEINEQITRHWIDFEPPKGIGEVETRIRNSLVLTRNGLGQDFIAMQKDALAFVGCGGIVPYPDFACEFEVIFWVKASLHGCGYGTELFTALLKWAKKNFHRVPYIVYSVTKGNDASAAIIRSMGAEVLRVEMMKKRGVMRKVTDYKLPLR